MTRLLEVKQQEELLAGEQKEPNEQLRLAHLRGDLLTLLPAGMACPLSTCPQNRGNPPAMATIPLHSDHHVRLGLEAQLRQFWAMYNALPSEANRNQLVRLERLLQSI